MTHQVQMLPLLLRDTDSKHAFPSSHIHSHTPSNQILLTHPVERDDRAAGPIFYCSANNSIGIYEAVHFIRIKVHDSAFFPFWSLWQQNRSRFSLLKQ